MRSHVSISCTRYISYKETWTHGIKIINELNCIIACSHPRIYNVRLKRSYHQRAVLTYLYGETSTHLRTIYWRVDIAMDSRDSRIYIGWPQRTSRLPEYGSFTQLNFDLRISYGHWPSSKNAPWMQPDGGHSIAPKTTSANAASASPQPPNEESR